MDFKGYEAVIGLEIHAQLKTQSKMFCADSASFDGLDNQHTSPVSVGMPGTLPVVNKRAIEYAILTGLALNCQVRRHSVFARKNYFYPDLPKGYQISQYDQPICEHGEISFYVDGVPKTISITRAHLEEDAGKSQHFGEFTLVNYNRSGVPLLEIVSGPDLRSPAEAAEYARTVRQVLRYLDVCDGNLEEGSLRCDCNVSVRKHGAQKFGTKVEIKNINSFRFVEKAIEYEIDRQIDLVNAGEKIVQETRLYDPDKNRTISMRSKEEAQDYRYFPDPDLLPVVISDQLFDSIQKRLPELPAAKIKRFQSDYQIPSYDALVLTQEIALADYFEAVAKISGAPKAASNWIMTEVLREMKEAGLDLAQIPLPAERLGKLIQLIEKATISGKIAKTVFSEMWKTNQDPESIIQAKGLVQISDSGALTKVIDDILSKEEKAVADYRGGRTKLFGFFVGAVMKATKGQANPEMVNQILTDKLKA